MVGILRRVFGNRGKAAHTGRHRTQGCSGRSGHFMHITETGWRCCRCPRTFDAGTREPKSTGHCACPVEQTKFVGRQERDVVGMAGWHLREHATVEQTKFVGRQERDPIVKHIYDDLWLPIEDTVVAGGARVRRQLAAAARGGRWPGRADAA